MIWRRVHPFNIKNGRVTFLKRYRLLGNQLGLFETNVYKKCPGATILSKDL